ncbi:MAG: PKD domain-containing protein [Saprospiraceae bacterium]|nr:PKD domain-containing protein [Saprospiraceae bacterium]
MNKSLLLVLTSVLSLTYAFGQITHQAVAKRLPAAAFEKALPGYQHFSMEMPDLPDDKASSVLLRLQLEGWPGLSFRLSANTLQAADFVMRRPDGSVIPLEETPATYQGHVEGQPESRVFLTLDKDYLFGYFEYGAKTWYLQPMNRFLKGVPEHYLLVSEAGGFSEGTAWCGLRSEPETPEIAESLQFQQTSFCSTLDIALAADYSMYAQFDNIFDLQRHVFGVLNMVQSNYLNDFFNSLVFRVSELVVATTPENDPWTPETDSEVFLTDFTTWGNNGGFSKSFDVASLWTDRLFNDSIVGLAWIREVCSLKRYNVLSDFFTDAQKLRVMQAHELGHNFGASHDKPDAPTIMAPKVNTATEWSDVSVVAVNSYLPLAQRCMSACSVQLAPEAAFTWSVLDTCDGYTLEFVDTSGIDFGTIKWLFDGGIPASSFSAQPEVHYPNPGVYDVYLIVQNPYGVDTLLAEGLVQFPEKLPLAIVPVMDTGSLEVQFFAQHISGSVLNWDFGDGRQSDSLNPVYAYDTSGRYEVRLTAKNDCATDTALLSLEVVAAPLANFDISASSGCDSLQVSFTNLSQAFEASYLWQFPGGNPATSTDEHPVVYYNTPGIYPVELLVRNAGGTSEVRKDSLIRLPEIFPLTILPTADTGSLQVEFVAKHAGNSELQWDFGDGNLSDVPSPVHSYDSSGRYEVRLTAKNDCGIDTAFFNLLVVQAPQAGFELSASSGCDSLEVSFTNQSQGFEANYNWIFPGGTPEISTESNPVVRYHTPGVYPVELQVSNAGGRSTLRRDSLIVVQTQPDSGFTWQVEVPRVVFSAPLEANASFEWFFGDGAADLVNPAPIHQYRAPGSYEVQLSVTNACGTTTSSQLVTLSGSTPKVGIAVAQDTFCNAATIAFQDTSTGDPIAWRWLFPGGFPDTSTLQNPTIRYQRPGVYDVALSITNAWGMDSKVEKNKVFILTDPKATIRSNQSASGVSFISTSSGGALRYSWDFGDGNTSQLETPFHVYDSAGTYRVQLVASNFCGSDTTAVEVSVLMTSTRSAERMATVSVYPNPNKGSFVIQAGNTAFARGLLQVDLFEANGRHVRRDVRNLIAENEAIQMDYQGLLPGVYILMLRGADYQASQKLIILEDN